MPALRRDRVIYGQIAWMLSTLLVLTLLRTFSLEAFVVLSIIGLLVLVGLTEPSAVSPRWRTRLRALLLAGLFGLSILAGWRILELMPTLGILK